MDRSDYSRTPRSRTEVEGRTKAPQTLSSAVSRWIHRLRVAHHRKSVFSGLSAVGWNASIRPSAQYQAPFDAAAVQLLTQFVKCGHIWGLTQRRCSPELLPKIQTCAACIILYIHEFGLRFCAGSKFLK